jgi:prepilin-type N-terminal cleavage/methylation domain-containing protein
VIASCKLYGFTLVEVLITLAILGIIATFTIPKIVYTQQDQKFNAVAKEDIMMIAQAHKILQAKGLLTSTVSGADFTPFMNYLTIDTSGVLIDGVFGNTTTACSATRPCIRIANGSVISYRSTSNYGGNSAVNAIHFSIDPDGKVTDGTTNGPGKKLSVFIYYDGRITDVGNALVGTTSNDSSYVADPAQVPPWFSW